MNAHFDVAIIGGGIVGLAHAWMAARRKQRVVLFEHSPVAQGASVRNFGMIWPIGQPAGELYAIALQSRSFWRELQSQGVVDSEECGSIHLAHQPDELAVLEEFCQQQSHEARMLSAPETLNRAPLANPDGLRGGMWSPTELRVDPRTASAQIARWLAENLPVQCHFETSITNVSHQEIHASDGRKWTAERTIICSGSDLRTLKPEILAKSNLKLCKLQMLKAGIQASPARTTPHIASGLTLRHYQSFQACPTLNALKSRVAEQSPELDRYGIHVMASRCRNGEVILGDSHEYGAEIAPFDKSEIDMLMLRELQKVIRLDNWTMTERWHGIYAKHPTLPVFEAECGDGIHICVGTGGAGMTMAFGLADRAWTRWIGEK